LFAARALPHAAGTRRKLDSISVLLNAGAFAALVIGAELLTSRPLMGAFLLVTAAFTSTRLIVREREAAHPLIPLDLLSVSSLRISVIASVLCFTGVTAALVALPFHLQHSFGLSVWQTGLCLTPWPLMVALGAPVSARLARRVSTARLCATGGAILFVGLAAGAVGLRAGSTLPLLFAVVTSCGLGFGLFQVPNNQNMFLSAPPSRSGAAGGLQGTARLTGQTLGAILMTLLFSQVPVEVAPRMGLGIAAVCAGAAGIVSALRGRDATRNRPARVLPWSSRQSTCPPP
jgi:DHA2 family multidrug resistance protein-like MFS transporter